MRPGAERLPGVDHDVQRCRPCRLPGRAHGQAVVDDQRAVEAAPALRPVIGDVRGRDLDQRPAGGGLQIRELGQLPGGAIDGVLDHVPIELGLLHPARGQLEQLGEHQLGVGAAARGRPGAARAGGPL